MAEVRDETDRDGLRIAIELKRDADAQGILNYLFKNTELQVTYNFNMVAINHQRPEHVGLVAILTAYLEHQRDVITRRTKYDLQKALDRQQIVEGLIKALSILDQVIATIRASKNRRDARDNLVSTYDFTEKQADAIVALQLYRLTNTDVTQLEDEAAKLAAAIETDRQILAEPKKLNAVLRKELKAIAKEYRNPRRTAIQDQIETLKIKTEVTVADEDVVVMVSHDGYLKRSSLRSYAASDAAENGLKDADYPIFMAQLSTLSHLMMFTNRGNLIYRPVHEIADVKWKETGEHLSQTIGLESDEEIVATYAFSSLAETGRFLIATSDGYIKQTEFATLKPGRTYKKRAAVYEKLKHPEARVVAVKYLAEPTDDRGVLLVSQNGYALRYSIDEVSVNGARTTGVRAMDLRDDDQVVNLALVTDTDTIALITQRGGFKRLAMTELTVTSRARRGVLILHELKRNPHRVVDFLRVPSENPALEIITDRERTHDVLPTDHPLSGRYSNGSFVVDTDVEGTPIQLRLKPIELVVS